MGCVPQDLLDKHIISLFVPSDREKLAEALSKLWINPQLNKANNSELRLQCPHSDIAWVNVTDHILPQEEQEHDRLSEPFTGENHLILMICENITKHKESKDSLQESEQRFHTMADHAPVMLWVSGTDTMRNFVNQSWLNFIGRNLEEELGWCWLEQIHPEDQNCCMRTYQSAFDTWEQFHMEYRLRRNNGDYRWVLDTGVPRFTPEGKFTGSIGSAMDITEGKLAEVALNQSHQATQKQLEQMEFLNRLKDQFLSTVSHELRTPLTNMKMPIQMLGIALDQPSSHLAASLSEYSLSKANRYFKIFNNECEREINLINNFLDLQRLDTNIKPLVMGTIDINPY